MKNCNNPLISIIIVNYNGKKYLERTLPKILNLNYVNKEIIIVDNGSIDWSIEFIKTFDNVKIIQSPRLREKNYAINLWVRESKWEYIFICDNDLLIVNLFLLEDLLVLYLKIKNIGILWISYKDEWQTITSWYGVFFWNYFIQSKPKLNDEILKKLNGIQIWYPHWIWFFIKKDIWNILWWFDEHFMFWWDDNDLGIKSWSFWFWNYIYTNTIQLHIWLQERVDNDKFIFKFQHQVFSELYVIFKNYTFLNMCKTSFFYTIFLFLKSIKQSVSRAHIWPFLAFLKWYFSLIMNIKLIFMERKKFQSKRKLKNDIFLQIKPPTKKDIL